MLFNAGVEISPARWGPPSRASAWPVILANRPINYSVIRTHREGRTIPEPLNLTVSLRGTREIKENCQIIRLTGLLDAFSEPTFRKVLGNCIDTGPKHIILGLSAIDFVDSSGLGALVQLVKKAQTEGGSVQLVTNARVTQTVKLVRLEKFLALQPSVEEAIASLANQ